MEFPTPEQIAERQRRHQAFWARAEVDRPLLLLTLNDPARTEDDLVLESLSQSDPERFWSEPEIIMRRARRSLARAICLGDSLPILRAPFGRAC
jgi:hypothetical protein